MRTSEILYEAADLIDANGWGQGAASMAGQDGICLMGAIFAATKGHLANPGEANSDAPYSVVGLCPAGQAVHRHLVTRENFPIDTAKELWRYNDYPDRIREDVTGLLRRAAADEAERERAGYIGEDPHEIELEPLDVPATIPAEPVPA